MYVDLDVRGIGYRVCYEEAGKGTPILLQHTVMTGPGRFPMSQDPERLKSFILRIAGKAATR